MTLRVDTEHSWRSSSVHPYSTYSAHASAGKTERTVFHLAADAKYDLKSSVETNSQKFKRRYNCKAKLSLSLKNVKQFEIYSIAPRYKQEFERFQRPFEASQMISLDGYDLR